MSQGYDLHGLEFRGRVPEDQYGILGADAMAFLAQICLKFTGERDRLMQLREERQEEINSGKLPDFVPETESIRRSDWKVDPIPGFLKDRRVEITGPSGDAKMVINALNSGAKVYMSDFEDAQSPTWKGILQGQRNLYEAVRGTLSYRSEDGREYSIGSRPAVLFVRPRGLHLDEVHLSLDGKPIPGAFFDFAIFFFNNYSEQISRGYAPCFYIPKVENRQEARLWNDIFTFSESYVGIHRGTIKATFLIETLLAAFEMDEILYESREHSAGLNCGRWDYIFSYIKKLSQYSEYVLPDRSSVTMDKGFLLAYSKLLIRTCHRRGAPAMGGMSAYIPVRGDESANAKALKEVENDKTREVLLGHDGTWVAHPGLVEVATKTFDRYMKTPNQIHSVPGGETIAASDLLAPVTGTVTEEGLRHNVRVGMQYISAWLSGRGAVPLYNLMEDAATAEISRSQIWQWIRHGSVMSNGVKVTPELVWVILGEEFSALLKSRCLEEAYYLLKEIALLPHFEEFFTTKAYSVLNELEEQE